MAPERITTASAIMLPTTTISGCSRGLNSDRVLVSWFRSSPHSDIDLLANFETKTTLGINTLPVSFRFRNPPRRYRDVANFGTGTLAGWQKEDQPFARPRTRRRPYHCPEQRHKPFAGQW